MMNGNESNLLVFHRLTAEKLLLHPFFKQAKRKDYLVKSILSYVPPLDQRAHRKTGFKQTTIEKNTIQQWDFDNSDEEEQEINVSQNVNSGNEPVPVPNTTRKSHISFGDVVVNNSKLEKPDLPSPALTEPEIASPVPVRKSRFVIEDNSYPTTDRNDITMSSQRSLSPNSNNNNLSVHSRCSSTTPSATATSVFHGHSPPITADSSWQSAMGVGLGICTGSSANPGVPSAPQQQQENVEVLRKGRFSVNQHNAPTSIRTTNIDSNSKFAEGAPGLSPIQPPESPYEMRSYPMSRITSNDSIKGGTYK
jgi:hypothetical protein